MPASLPFGTPSNSESADGDLCDSRSGSPDRSNLASVVGHPVLKSPYRLVLTVARGMTSLLALEAALAAVPAQAQVVGACSGVQLPRSVVTDITGQVVAGPLGQVESLLDTLLIGTVNLNLSGALTSAASGAPITLQAIDVNGNAVNVVGPASCTSQASSFTLQNQAGMALGGNSITGLGTAGHPATAGALTAIAVGDDASTATGAVTRPSAGRSPVPAHRASTHRTRSAHGATSKAARSSSTISSGRASCSSI